MTIIRSIAMSLSMFSKLPMPQLNWEKANMRYLLAALPIVGVFIGLLLWLWSLLCSRLNFGNTLYAAGLMLIPIAFTGGIHLDGFCDTVDALASRAAPERKREILKDPRCGAFAVIWTTVYVLSYFALCVEYSTFQSSALQIVIQLSAIAVMGRAAGAFASVAFPSSGAGDLLDTFRDPAGKASAVILVVWFIAGSFFAPFGAIAILLCSAYVRVMSKRQFGGMSGDIAGYLIAIGEIFAIAATLAFQRLGGFIWFL
ncbi:MAG: adenosylcobinamide-GDP ribazoletransferase [Oscillospiraceae bacterium]|jgi:adenosylcobinamide-GDP ribazoletransferase|nr:adenosylcobinamide-GDP ribazoletransferase [Oscillospiraceae bacterium]